MGMASATLFSIVGMTLGIIIGSSLGKSTGNKGFMRFSAPGILPIRRIIDPMPKGMASIISGHMVPMSLAKPSGVIRAIIASKTAQFRCTSGLGLGKSYPSAEAANRARSMVSIGIFFLSADTGKDTGPHG